MMNVYEKYSDAQIKSPFFVHGAACVKNIRVERGINRESLVFYMRRCVCKNYKNRTGHQSGAP
jgi:hypothetical protein